MTYKNRSLIYHKMSGAGMDEVSITRFMNMLAHPDKVKGPDYFHILDTVEELDNAEKEVIYGMSLSEA